MSDEQYEELVKYLKSIPLENWQFDSTEYGTSKFFIKIKNYLVEVKDYEMIIITKKNGLFGIKEYVCKYDTQKLYQYLLIESSKQMQEQKNSLVKDFLNGVK